jgi:hypothetical protein
LLRVHTTKTAKPSANNINVFSMADLLSGQQLPDPSAQDKNSGRRLDANAVVTAMPAVKARARIMAVFFMAISLFSIVDVARTGQELP